MSSRTKRGALLTAAAVACVVAVAVAASGGSSAAWVALPAILVAVYIAARSGRRDEQR